MRHYLPALLLTLAIPMAHAEETQLRLARYSSVPTHAEVADYAPLETIATLNFPADVGTVGDAFRYALIRTGYTLGDTDAHAAHLLGLPLPHSHRALGPAPVSDLLAILVGPAYALDANPVDRTVALALASAPIAHAEPLPSASAPIHVVVESAPAATNGAAVVDEVVSEPVASEARATSAPDWLRSYEP